MTLLERRRALMSQTREKYVFVEYIQSTGTQWIDTGFVPKNTTRVVMDFQVAEITASFIFGSRVSGSSKAYTFNMSKTGFTEFKFLTVYGSGGSMVSATADTSRHTVDKNKRTTYFDSAVAGMHNSETFTSPGSLELLACYNNGTKGYLPSKIKLYSCQIYDNGTLVRDVVPCYRKSDKVAGLYDKANDIFYENQGTGNFLIGGEI